MPYAIPSIFSRFKRQKLDEEHDPEKSYPKTKKLNINDLPEEMLLHVLSFIPHAELRTTIPLVCPRWRELHDDVTLYRHLVFTKNEPTTNAALQMIEMAPRLWSVQMTGRSDADALLAELAESQTTLKTLVIHSCWGSGKLPQVCSKQLRTIISRCTTLSHLSLKGTYCSDFQFYVEIGQMLPLLRIVDFGWMPDEFCSTALNSLTTNCNLIEEVHVREYFSYDFSNEVICSFLNKFKDTLRIAEFNQCFFWTDKAITALAKCHNMACISLTRANVVSDAGMMELSSMPNLVDLTVHLSTFVTTEGWLRFFSTPQARRLKRVTLILCPGVNDRVARLISTRLTNLEANYVRCCITPRSRIRVVWDDLTSLLFRVKRVLLRIYHLKMLSLRL